MMFSGFKISINQEGLDYLGCYDSGAKLFEEYKRKSYKAIREYVSREGKISATRLEHDWFPAMDADVFLSHSHKDEKVAIKLAGWLYDNFGVKTFIDSCVWGYVNDLLLEINGEYSLKRIENDGTKTYFYDKTNNAAAHIHMILNGALSKMIDSTECLIFLNTPNSISVKQSVDKTYSPWIYSELLLSTIVEHKKLEEYRRHEIDKRTLSHVYESSNLEMEYDAYTDHLEILTIDDLELWKNENRRNKEAWKSMDCLYRMKGLIQKNILG